MFHVSNKSAKKKKTLGNVVLFYRARSDFTTPHVTLRQEIYWAGTADFCCCGCGEKPSLFSQFHVLRLDLTFGLSVCATDEYYGGKSSEIAKMCVPALWSWCCCVHLCLFYPPFVCVNVYVCMIADCMSWCWIFVCIRQFKAHRARITRKSKWKHSTHCDGMCQCKQQQRLT